MSYPNPATIIRNARTAFLTRDEFSQIAQTTLTAGAASVTFASIPQQFRSLLLILQLRTDRAAESDNVFLRYNADAGNNYDWIQMSYNSAAGAGGNQGRAAANIYCGFCEAANSRASNFSLTYGLISGYSRADGEKFGAFLSGVMGNVSADADLYILYRYGRWRNTNAITSLTVLPQTGPNFVSGSILQLYGLA